MSTYVTEINFHDDRDKLKQGLRILAKIIIREYVNKSPEVSESNEYEKIIQNYTKRSSTYQGAMK